MCRRTILNHRLMRLDGRWCIVDACLVPQLQRLRAAGVTTLASCCGHGELRPWIDVCAKDISKAEELGYEVISEFRNRGTIRDPKNVLAELRVKTREENDVPYR